MASGPNTFVTCVVFSAEKFQGNPLAIVSVRADSLTQARKSLIAKEFGYSETVFLHDAAGPGQPRKLEIFTERGEEIPFAGHPVIGAAHYIFSQIEKMPYRGPSDRDAVRQNALISTKAGLIPISYNNYRQVAACAVPHKFHVHSKRIHLKGISAVQPQIQLIPAIEKLEGMTFPVVSIVHGMTFTLVDLTDAPEVFEALEPRKAPEVELDEEWKPSFVACMYYKRMGRNEKPGEPVIHSLQARMITHGMEDPGTGSASCALACYLTLHESFTTSAIPDGKAQENKSAAENELASKTANVNLEDNSNTATAKPEHSIFAIEQGVQMGRKCTIAIEVDCKTVSGIKQIASVVLSGRANFMLRGELLGF